MLYDDYANSHEPVSTVEWMGYVDGLPDDDLTTSTPQKGAMVDSNHDEDYDDDDDYDDYDYDDYDYDDYEDYEDYDDYDDDAKQLRKLSHEVNEKLIALGINRSKQGRLLILEFIKELDEHRTIFRSGGARAKPEPGQVQPSLMFRKGGKHGR
ncbi:hypothetical protein M0802_002837 [Mischocyttarus mexicanus]|nr:hypothetical protein M0802_002837 [Mischocyttarus mexicanus]